MKWTKEDLEQFANEKEYIDTLFIPVVPVSVTPDEKMITSGFQRELNELFSRVTEEQFKGRIVLSPEFHYLDGEVEIEKERLNRWIDRFSGQSFHHIFLFTFDRGWRKIENELNGELLWFPGLRKGNLESTETQSFVREQAKEIVEIIKDAWKA